MPPVAMCFTTSYLPIRLDRSFAMGIVVPKPGVFLPHVCHCKRPGQQLQARVVVISCMPASGSRSMDLAPRSAPLHFLGFLFVILNPMIIALEKIAGFLIQTCGDDVSDLQAVGIGDRIAETENLRRNG